MSETATLGQMVVSTLGQMVVASLSSQWGSEFLRVPAYEMTSQETIPFESLDVEYQFNTLRRNWHRERGAASSTTAITNCPSYRLIGLLGDSVLPFIFRDLERRPDPDHWFAALREITNADPVPIQDRGKHRAMAKAWLKWARARGYAW